MLRVCLTANIALSYALFHFIAKVRKFINPRLLIKSTVDEFKGIIMETILNFGFEDFFKDKKIEKSKRDRQKRR